MISSYQTGFQQAWPIPIMPITPLEVTNALKQALITLHHTYQARRGLEFDLIMRPFLSSDQLNSVLNNSILNQIPLDQNLSEFLGDIILYAIEDINDPVSSEILEALLNKCGHLMQPNGPFGLGRIMVNLACAGKFNFMQAILVNPCAKDIQTQQINLFQERFVDGINLGGLTSFEKKLKIGQFGLTEALYYSIAFYDHTCNLFNDNSEIIFFQKQLEFFEFFVYFANYNNVQLISNGPFSLAHTLEIASNHNEGKLIPAILNLHASRYISQNDEESSTLCSALKNVVTNGFSDAVKRLLKHPNIWRISRSILQDNLNKAEENDDQEIAQILRDYMK